MLAALVRLLGVEGVERASALKSQVLEVPLGQGMKSEELSAEV